MKVTYTAIIIDDEKININLLSKLINRCCPDIEIVATASNFENGIASVKYQSKYGYINKQGVQFWEN